MSKIKELEEWISMLDTRVQTINDRTKRQTKDIMELRRTVKELQK